MEEIIDRRVALALSKQFSQQPPAASGANDEMSPSNKHIKAASLPRRHRELMGKSV